MVVNTTEVEDEEQTDFLIGCRLCHSMDPIQIRSACIVLVGGSLRYENQRGVVNIGADPSFLKFLAIKRPPNWDCTRRDLTVYGSGVSLRLTSIASSKCCFFRLYESENQMQRAARSYEEYLREYQDIEVGLKSE